MSKTHEIIGNPQTGNLSLGIVMWRFSGVRTSDNVRVYGEHPFTYIEGRECYNMAAFWRHVQSGYIDQKTVEYNAT